ncbi:wax ester/triacylglycerol synthase family O-acyltransferase [Variovorax sp. J2P1-59]|uniref:WS/DGAT/MGAT family O-acyltransferase n=1 Tax=Variovorax flavidus TaxID=3053501 RepID=UPI002576CB7F|nr:wax ester/triacylglycerol synthase family O-acyltransferase [Variovorax sp. J2P1-59]MDM0077421.1 wax ester/triacylglycerol synthase family O-acyltransferase [Variovorax sp. J2P1-59]
MKHLSGLDATFLHTETPETPMHVGGLHVLELPAGYKGDFYEDVKAHVQSRMHLSEVFTRKLALMPFELSNPVWVDDDDVDLAYHVRRVTLPRPGTLRQLEQYVARLHSTLLDRSRPLWEFFVIDGLQGGGVALYSKLHHAGIDGQAGAAFAEAIMDLTPEPRVIKAPRQMARRNRYQLGVAELAGAALTNTLQQYVKLVKTFPDMARAVKSLVVPQPTNKAGSLWKLPKNLNLLGPRTPLNVAITNQRAYAVRSIPLAEVKLIGKRLGASLNDVVLGLCAGALRHYLSDHGKLPKKPLTAAIPVTLREPGDTTSNNQVSMTVMTLATDVADPIERIKAIAESSAAAKSLMGNIKAAIPTDFPSFGAPWLMSGLASMYGRSRFADRLPPVANVVISNVPGAPVPLYFAGAKLLTYYPVSIPSHGMALNMTVQSYNGMLDFGLIACRRAVPDVDDIADYLVEEHRALLARVKALDAPATAAEVVPASLPAKAAAARPRKTPARKTAARKTVARKPAARKTATA